MKLVDWDKVKISYDKQVSGTITEPIYNIRIEAPTVEAIPVEWLLDRAKLCTADYANCLRYSVEAWQNEQKYMVNGQWKFPKEWEKENG